MALYQLFDLPHINQVHVFYRAELADLAFAVGVESLEVRLFEESEIPWDELAFRTVSRALECYYLDRQGQHYPGYRFMRWLLALFCLGVASVSQAAFTETIVRKPLGQVLVIKSERRLQLMSGDTSMKSYRISLGKQPTGAKLREGDKRTPEGLYWLDWRKVSDRYNLAIHVSYPNVSDSARA
uniref:DUF4390 domain-containing protein n=1 Tax=Steinernema glaseri TaxID=37863 RepID=A0A1I8ANM7_9BILA